MGGWVMRRISFGILLSVFIVLAVTTSCKNPNLSGGILHFDQKRYERARETLLKAIEQEPQNSEAYFWLGKSYAELDSTMKAKESFEKSVEVALPAKKELASKDVENAMDHYWSVRHNEGLSYAKAAQDARAIDKSDEARKNFRFALNQFKKARVFNGSKEETPRNMGVCYFNLGQVDSGLVSLKEAQRLSPAQDSRAGQILFDQFRSLGDQAAEKGTKEGYTDAIKFYSEAESLRSNDPDLLYSLGVVYYQLAEADTAQKKGSYAKAIEYFEKTLTYKPEDQDALYNAASLYYELRNCDPGVALAKRLLDINPKEGRYYDIVGRLLDCQGKKAERVAGLVFSRALKSGTVVAADAFKAEVEKYGTTSDAMRKYREEGKPEDVRTFTDAGGADYMCWFFWTRGKALAFIRGEYKYEMGFKPQKETAEGETGK